MPDTLTTLQQAMAPTPWDYSEPEDIDALVFALQEEVRKVQGELADLQRVALCGICREPFTTANINCGGDCQQCVKDAEAVSLSDTTFADGYFLYGVYEDSECAGAYYIGVTTADEFAAHGCCKDGLTEDEANRIYEVMGAVGAGESMESIFTAPFVIHREAIHELFAPLFDWKHSDEFAAFLADCNA